MLSEEFSVLLEELKFEHSDEVPLDDVELLMTWYNVDTNIHPHLHRLQPISSIIKNFKSQVKHRNVNGLMLLLTAEFIIK